MKRVLTQTAFDTYAPTHNTLADGHIHSTPPHHLLNENEAIERSKVDKGLWVNPQYLFTYSIYSFQSDLHGTVGPKHRAKRGKRRSQAKLLTHTTFLWRVMRITSPLLNPLPLLLTPWDPLALWITSWRKIRGTRRWREGWRDGKESQIQAESERTTE